MKKCAICRLSEPDKEVGPCKHRKSMDVKDLHIKLSDAMDHSKCGVKTRGNWSDINNGSEYESYIFGAGSVWPVTDHEPHSCLIPINKAKGGLHFLGETLHYIN